MASFIDFLKIYKLKKSMGWIMSKKIDFLLVLIVIFLLCLVIFVGKTVISANEAEAELDRKLSVEDEIVANTSDISGKTVDDSDVKIEVVMNKVVCIDPGHQQKADMSKEPIGPGAKKKKAKVDGGAIGVKSGMTEYQLNLNIALKLQKILEDRGYTVVMTRTTNDVNISNSQRAQIANEASADAFVRIHADSINSSSVNGATTLCQTKNNPYNGALYEQSRSLADCVINGLTASAGCKKRSTIETDDMSGINWCQVPTTIVEVGYMSNPREDGLLATDSYQQLIAEGIADGIDEYFATGSN